MPESQTIPPPPPLFLQGVEHFNRREFFECHEVLEDLWRPLPPGPDKQFLQGLIQVAVALHHLSRANLTGARNLLQAALPKLDPPPPPFPAWIDLPPLITQTRLIREKLLTESPGALRPEAYVPYLPIIRLLASASAGAETEKNFPTV